MGSENYINHIAFVLDASGSMDGLQKDLIRIFDAQKNQLAEQSQQLNQETRATVYTFDDRVKCIHYDMDVLRMPSIADSYKLGGRTALIDATIKSIEDLQQTATLYGDHSFLIFVLTDGAENQSRNTIHRLKNIMAGLPAEWTVAILVPNSMGKHYAQQFGFAPGNIAIWDATSTRGLEESMTKVAAATTSYMTTRASGLPGSRGTKNLFGGAAQVNAATVAATGLQPQNPNSFVLHPIPGIPDKTEVRDYIVGKLGIPFRLGTVFYQLTKPEKVQAGKKIAIREKGTDKVYIGEEVRAMLGLPAVETRIRPDANPAYQVFIQSNSTNRHLVAHTTLLVLK